MPHSRIDDFNLCSLYLIPSKTSTLLRHAHKGLFAMKIEKKKPTQRKIIFFEGALYFGWPNQSFSYTVRILHGHGPTKFYNSDSQVLC